MFAQGGGPDETVRSPSRSRQDEKWASTIFEGPIVEQSKRKRLNYNDKGGDHLFGTSKIDYANRSNNISILTNAKKACEKKWKPVRAERTAE